MYKPNLLIPPHFPQAREEKIWIVGLYSRCDSTLTFTQCGGTDRVVGIFRSKLSESVNAKLYGVHPWQKIPFMTTLMPF